MKQMTNKYLLYSRAKHIQYLVIIHKGKESKKEYIYMYNWVTFLYIWKYNIVNQLSFNKKLKLKKNI